jgi:RNA methyltransferase, TrmH family
LKEIQSTTNPQISHFSLLMKKNTYRKETGRFLVEGKNLIYDLTKRHPPIQLLLTKKNLHHFSHFKGEILLISDAIAQKISDVESPEGCFAEYQTPNLVPKKLQRALVLDGLQDPGNVGTLLRTALGFAMDAIFFIEPMCDPWNPKTLRAAKGAQLDLPLIKTTYDELPNTLPILVADTSGENLQTFSAPKEWLLVLGSEALGPSIPPSKSATKITIQTSPKIESLNVAVAGGIAMYALTT